MHDHLLAISAGQNDSHVWPNLRSFSKDCMASRPSDRRIQEDQTNLVPTRTKKFECRGPLGSFKHVVAGAVQRLDDALAKGIFIFHNQYDPVLTYTLRLVDVEHGITGCASRDFGA